MSGLEDDTIGGYNSLLTKQQAEEGEVVITTVLFDDKYELLHDRINLKAVSPITDKDYYVRGCTALLDAIGKTINKIKTAQANTSEEYRADNVLVAITTDGMENASKEFDYDKIKNMVEQQTEAGWEFIFLGANIDAIETAGRFGIRSDRASNYHADGAGIMFHYQAFNKTVSHLRSYGSVPDGWDEEIKRDYSTRKSSKKAGQK
jgi:hypothetical protein